MSDKTCTWTYNDFYECWDTECGNRWCLDEGTPKENHMNFCLYCGKPLKAKERTRHE